MASCKNEFLCTLLGVRKFADALIETAFYFSILGVSVRSYIELPFYTKYLLIAAYLASYNPAHTDRRFFTKQGRRGISNRAKAAAKGKKSNTQLTGTTVYRGVALDFVGVRTGRNVRPPKELKTRWGWGPAPP